MLCRDGVVYPTYAPLRVRPEPLYGVRVNVATYIDLLRVVHTVMAKALKSKPIVRFEFVSVDDGRRNDLLGDVGHQSGPFDVGYRNGPHLPVAFNASENWNLVRPFPRATTRGVAPPATNVRFIGFNRSLASDGVVALGHEFLANLFGHAPRSLVGHTKLAFKLFSGDAVASASHEVHGVEPQVQRRRRLVEDSSSSRMQMISAANARPRLALLRSLIPLKLTRQFALRAIRTFPVRRGAAAPQPVKARRIIGELTHELHERIRRFRGSGSFGIFSVCWWHSISHLSNLRLCYQSSLIQLRDSYLFLCWLVAAGLPAEPLGLAHNVDTDPLAPRGQKLLRDAPRLAV